MRLYEIWTDSGRYIGLAWGTSHEDSVLRFLKHNPKTQPNSIHARLSPKN